MDRDYHLPAPVIQAAHEALKEGDCWVVFNVGYKVMDVEDIAFYHSKTEAEFACDMKSNGIDWFEMKHIDSVDDFVKKFSQAKEIPDLISKEATRFSW